MGYNADLSIDLAFRSQTDLDMALASRAGAQPSGGDMTVDPAWALLAELSEYADGHLDGLHLTGWGGGKLLSGYHDRITELAQHADGTIDGIGEDNHLWRDRLADGQITSHEEPAGYPTDTAPPALVHGAHEPRLGEPEQAARR
ncbi:MAG: hypothetical protein WCF12_08285 [Propionicimonas sp.]